jgi:hypothetical protein
VGSALRPREVVGHLKVDAQLLGEGGEVTGTFVIGHERNQQAEDPEASLITRLRSLKNRPRSRTGEMTWLREV